MALLLRLQVRAESVHIGYKTAHLLVFSRLDHFRVGIGHIRKSTRISIIEQMNNDITDPVLTSEICVLRVERLPEWVFPIDII